MFCLGTVYQWLWTNLSSIEWYWMSGTFHRMEENISRKMDFVKSYQHSNIFVGANNVQLILTYGRMFHGSINSNNVDSYNICIWGGFCHTTCPLEETLTGKNLSLWISTTETGWTLEFHNQNKSGQTWCTTLGLNSENIQRFVIQIDDICKLQRETIETVLLLFSDVEMFIIISNKFIIVCLHR